ncbi:MAG: urease accessory protein UreE [Pseudomonadota bacterium]
MSAPWANSVRRHVHHPDDTIGLDYDARLLRRKRLTSASGLDFMVDLAEVTHLDHLDAFVLEDGRTVGVVAAPEALIRIEGDLPRLAWHIGNRHTPCQVAADHLLIRSDHVLRAMLAQLGATLSDVEGPFTPEGGAYGHGRTFGHEHGHEH